MSLRGVDDHESPQMPFLYYLSIAFLVNDTGVVFRCILHSLEFSIFFHLHCLTPRAIESSLPYYFSRDGRGQGEETDY